MAINLQSKRADETRRYRHDWSAFLGDDTITSQATTSSDVTVVSSDVDAGDQSITFTVEGGTDGAIATIAQAIITAAGDEETEIFILRVGQDEPVSLSEAKVQVNMASDDSQDAFLMSLIAPARAYVERIGRRLFVGGARAETFNAWGDYLEIWRQPIASVDTIAYSISADPEDDEAYTGYVANLGFPARVYPAVAGSFPDLIDGGTITVTYTAGALDPTSEEYLIGRRAMLLLIGHWFEFREAAAAGIVSSEIAFAVTSLLDCIRPVSAY